MRIESFTEWDRKVLGQRVRCLEYQFELRECRVQVGQWFRLLRWKFYPRLVKNNGGDEREVSVVKNGSNGFIRTDKDRHNQRDGAG